MAITVTGTTTHTKTLISPSSGSEDKVYGEDYVSATSHTTSIAFAGLTADCILYSTDGTTLAQSTGLKWGPTAGLGLQIAAGTATTDVNALSLTQTWNAAGVTFKGARIVITDTASAAGSLAMQILGGAAGSTTLFSVSKGGALVGNGLTSVSGTLTLTGTGGTVDLIGNGTARWDVNGFYPTSGAFNLGYSGGGFTWNFLNLGNNTNQQKISLNYLTELTTIAAAATTDTTIQMPAGAIVLGVSVRTTVTIPTASNYTVGDSGSAARFSTAAVSATAPSTDAGTKAGAYYNATALAVRITPDLTPASNTGRVRVTIHYFLVTPPTS